jgi:hypothetical protein
MSPEFEIEAPNSSPSAAVRKRRISTPDRPLNSERLCGTGYSACPRLGNLKTHKVGRSSNGRLDGQLIVVISSVLTSNLICRVAEDVLVVAQPSIAEILTAQAMSHAFPDAV